MIIERRFDMREKIANKIAAKFDRVYFAGAYCKIVSHGEIVRRRKRVEKLLKKYALQ
jgi:hypothetical protein